MKRSSKGEIIEKDNLWVCFFVLRVKLTAAAIGGSGKKHEGQ